MIALFLASIAIMGQGFPSIRQTEAASASCIDLPISGVSANGYEQRNPPSNAIDDSLKTRWSEYGTGSWIRADLGEQMAICSVDIAWYKGNQRINNFVIAVSSDGTSYTNVYSGKNSGTTIASEQYSFSETVARYVRITVNGNTQTLWTSITEIGVNGHEPIKDTIDPAIEITSPANGATLIQQNGKITFHGTASDDTALDRVGLRVDNGQYSMATPKAAGDWSTWSASFDMASGQHVIYARATDKTGNQALASSSITTSSGTSSGGSGGTEPPASDTGSLDNFGIKKLYATKSGGNEWYVNMADPTSDPMFRNLPSMTKQPDGSWQVSGGSKGQVRMEAWSPANEKWQNVEITMYAKMVSGSNELLQMYSRGGHHTSSNECLGSAYKARIYGDGEARWVKEVTHPAYTSNRGNVQATTDPLEGRWIGFKAVIYNFVVDGKTYVRMQSYIDDDVTDSNGNLVIRNNWKLASVVEDSGGWATSNPDFDETCFPVDKDSNEQNRQRDEILSLPGGTSTQNIAAWRSDGLTWNWKYLTVREVTIPTT